MWNEKLAPQQSLYYNQRASRFGTHFDNRPSQILPIINLFKNCPIKINVKHRVIGSFLTNVGL